MPTFKHAKTAQVRLLFGATVTVATGAVTGGTTVNLSSGVTDAAMSRAVDTSDVTTFGDSDRAFLAGLRNGTFSFNGILATTYEDKVTGLLGTSTGVAIVFSPHGTASGSPKFTAGIILTQADVSAPVADAVKATFAAQRTGAVLSTKY